MYKIDASVALIVIKRQSKYIQNPTDQNYTLSLYLYVYLASRNYIFNIVSKLGTEFVLKQFKIRKIIFYHQLIKKV